jgi:hypothetical protein
MASRPGGGLVGTDHRGHPAGPGSGPIPFKGTELFRQVEHAGYALPTDWSAYEPYETDINLSTVPEKSIFRLRKQAYRRFYWSPARMFRIFRLIPNKTNMLPFLTLLFARRAYAH